MDESSTERVNLRQSAGFNFICKLVSFEAALMKKENLIVDFHRDFLQFQED